MNIKALVMTVVAVALGATLLAQDQAREQKLQQAIDLLETKGDAARAMSLLEDVAKSSDRRLAARALLYLGQAQERQGKDVARRTYERIIREFGAQQDVVATARVRLASLGNEPAGRRSDLTIRRLQALQETVDAISNDGAKTLETDWNTGHVVVREIATGQAHPITLQPPGSGSNYEEFGEEAIFSADGSQAAYTWCTTVVKATATMKSTCDGHLRVSRIVDGGSEKPRVVYSGATWTQPYDWSADGRVIAALVIQPDRSAHLAVITVADGTARVLKALGDSNWPARMAFSPDGRYLAYDSSLGGSAAARTATDVFVIATAGGEPRAVASEISRELFVGWSPDGAQVLFTSDHGGTVDLHAVRVVAGQRQGRALVLKADLGNVGVTRVTPSGALYYTKSTGGGSRIELASLDFSTGGSMTAPVPADDASPGINSGAEWTPDGSSLAYLSRRTGGPARATIVLRSTENGAALEVRPDLIFQQLRWGPDPSVVYTTGTDGRSKQGLFSIDLRNAATAFLSDRIRGQLRVTADRRRMQYVRTAGESSQLIERDLVSGVEHEVFAFNGRKIEAAVQLSPDGKKLYYRLPKEGATAPLPESALLERDLASGSERLMLQGRLGLIFLSPDGRHIAIPRSDPGGKWHAVTLVSTAGNPAARDLMRIETGVGLRFAAWAPDGRSVLLLKPATASSIAESWWVSVPDGLSRRLPYFVGVPSVHPDGKRLAFQVDSGEPRGYEIWAMEHFLPPASTKKGP